jgi:Family of unknown function (DUF6095)
MATNRNLLTKGVVKLAAALPLLFLGPTVIHNAFINKQNIWHWLVLVIGIAICGVALFFMYKGLNTIMKSMFND